MLTNEQRALIVKGIQRGIKDYQDLVALMPVTRTKKHAPHLLYDMVNESVATMIEDNPHTLMKVIPRKAGFHPYIVIHDTIRNLFILVSKLPRKKYIPTPCNYRGEFASANAVRLNEMGMSMDEIYGDTPYQESLSLGIDNQPFGIVVTYDSKQESYFEGALRPDQEDWIYKEDISDSINIDIDALVPLNNYQLSDIPTPLKTSLEEDIVVKLKGKTTS
ncbi:hypothetical protein [Peribacillus asahii]|uniref:hypothetical protein n=1 Tax=Peribacillus asahii TaxID=228899 RepID=UPI0020798D31|nr:hypothetical protein [Peribacillus asahii]USK60406.1 hypothetical protein LIT37_03380 [Peribacillus asahii]